MKPHVLHLNADFLRLLLSGGNAFVNAQPLLEDLTGDQAARSLSDQTHTIAEIVAHLNYWQNWFYQAAVDIPAPYPDSGDDSWPEVSAEAWGDLRDAFLARLEEIKALCDDAELLERSFSRDAAMGGGHSERTVGMTLLYTVALHNGHHLGQIVTMRQLMGLWPPEGGGIRW